MSRNCLDDQRIAEVLEDEDIEGEISSEIEDNLEICENANIVTLIFVGTTLHFYVLIVIRNEVQTNIRLS